MKLTVLKWLGDFLVDLLGKLIECLFRIILFILPLGVYMFILQNRKKVSKVSNISVYTNDQSVWQHVFPGFMLVAIDPTSFNRSINSIKGRIQDWIKSNKYLLTMIFMISIIAIMVWKGI